MAQAERGPRLDSYGKPLPGLAENRHRVTLEEPSNQARLSLLHALVEDACRAVLREGWHGNVQIRFSVSDGIIQRDIYAGLERQWRTQAEGDLP